MPLHSPFSNGVDSPLRQQFREEIRAGKKSHYPVHNKVFWVENVNAFAEAFLQSLTQEFNECFRALCIDFAAAQDGPDFTLVYTKSGNIPDARIAQAINGVIRDVLRNNDLEQEIPEFCDVPFSEKELRRHIGYCTSRKNPDRVDTLLRKRRTRTLEKNLADRNRALIQALFAQEQKDQSLQSAML